MFSCGCADEVHRYNHNLETARSFFTNVVTTHTWEERWETLSMVREAGMEVCCGGSALVNESHCCRQADPGRAAGDHRGFPGQKRHFDHAHA
jgi:hypothetical protein